MAPRITATTNAVTIPLIATPGNMYAVIIMAMAEMSHWMNMFIYPLYQIEESLEDTWSEEPLQRIFSKKFAKQSPSLARLGRF